MDLQSVLAQLNEIERQARITDLTVSDLIDDLQDVIADIENAIG